MVVCEGNQMMKRRIFLSMVFLGLGTFFLGRYRIAVMPYLVDESAPYRAQWEAQGLVNYALTFVQTGPPYLFYGVQERTLVYLDDGVTYRKRYPDCKLFFGACYSRVISASSYIDDYFERAQQCTNETKAAYALLKPFSDADFHGFASRNQLQNFLDAEPLLVTPKHLCAVAYDPVYGFPKDIWWSSPNEDDGTNEWHITKLEFLTEEAYKDPYFLLNDAPFPLTSAYLPSSTEEK